MKNLLVLLLTTGMILLTTTAFADRGYGRGDYDGYYSKGERIERHFDRKGDRTERYFDRKADRAEAKGKYRKADRLRYKGDRIDRHFDRKGKRIHARHDHRHKHKHYKRHKHYAGHRHYYPRPRVVYHDYPAYNSHFGLVISQPGFWFGWDWYD